MEFKNIRLVGIVATIGLLLLVPFVAMRITDEVNWTVFDFVVMGVLLLVTGLLIEAALRKLNGALVKAAAVLAILFGFIMVWGALVRLGG
ncbi:MAG TPA: hypothetical protein PKD26_15315 [Pyrinomonadaceae bacterium]|nr:hypothetical protein [Pyrinomonadaceae bacterium]